MHTGGDRDGRGRCHARDGPLESSGRLLLTNHQLRGRSVYKSPSPPEVRASYFLCHGQVGGTHSDTAGPTATKNRRRHKRAGVTGGTTQTRPRESRAPEPHVPTAGPVDLTESGHDPDRLPASVSTKVVGRKSPEQWFEVWRRTTTETTVVFRGGPRPRRQTVRGRSLLDHRRSKRKR